ncbi:baseplate J/gp47 family protein [Amycolatopsis vancoresmycina]|uniref:baseplate J/gp47 family protein n=1 Tax=Amycolatopsis vancoresmycina TaxID=208444 RepID=UPI001F0AA1D7|nr:baseplate J/gp47 family protein [Amycolatopsis vancoresmycina]
MLEQRLFWLDQVPDALVVAILRLLGLEPPRPARPAVTVLRLGAAGRPGLVVPAGTAFWRDPAGVLRFTLDDDVAVFPVDGVVGVVTDRDRTADLVAGRGVPLFSGDGGAASVRFALPLTGEYPAPGWLSLLFEVDSPVAPSWSSRAVAVGAPAELRWSVFREGGDARPCAEVVDGTGGFRRSGVVRLRLPAGWTSGERGLLVSTEAAAFAAPPRLVQVAVNVSAARQLERRTADLAGQTGAWLKLPGQRLVLPDAADRLLDAVVRIAGDEWTPVPDFTFGASADRTFVVSRSEGACVFGDGLTGRIPRPGGDVRVAYSVGGGRAGNGGVTANWVSESEVTAANVVQAAEGSDPETVAEARERAAGSLGEVTRAVTAADFVTLARTTPGVAVARAYAALGAHPGYPCSRVPGAVTVHIVPSVPDDVVAPQPDPAMVCAVAGRLAGARLLTAEVFVRGPRYRDVGLRVDLSGLPADRARVSAVVTSALRGFLVDGVDGTGWPFGGALRPSALVRAARMALGDLADVAGVAIGLDGAEPVEDCREVPLRPGELPVLRSVRTRVVAVAEPGEGLV